MGTARSLCLLAIGCLAWLTALPVAAEDEKEKHSENSRSRPAAPSSNQPSSPARTPSVGAIYSGPSRAPQAQGNSGGNDRGTSGQSIGSSILNDLLFGSSSSSGSDSYSSTVSASSSASHADLHTQLNERGIASYAGLGLGKSIAYYPLNSSSDTALKIFGGFRTQYIGAELGANFLSTISTTVNSQAVDVSTDAYSLALLGYLPLDSHNADFYLKYGGVYWDVNARSNSGNNMPVQSGFNRVLGFGFEFRSDIYFLRLEKDFYRQIYQSSLYTYVGASFGIYTE